MSFKAKTVLNNDIRVFKQDIDTMEDGLEAIKKFIKDKYAIEGAFSIQYEDEEKDIITVASSEDLEEAYSQAEANGSVLKLLVVPENSNAPVYEFTSELDKSALNEQEKQQGNNNEFSSDEEEEEKESNKKQEEEECFGKKLLQDLIENEEFRKEFINFIVSFIKIIQQDIEKFSNEALIQALSKHENISQHPSMKKLLDIFPLLFQHFEPLLFFINTINAENVGVWINNIINLLSNVDFNQLHSLPMMLMSWFGLPFGHGSHGPHGGYHMPPPPPPPFWFGNPCHGYNNNFNPFHSFGNFMPPPTPPPSACPFGFNGVPFHHGRRHGHGHGHGHGHHAHGPHGNHHFGHGPHQQDGNSFGFGCPMFNNNRCHGKRMWCGQNKNNENKENKECHDNKWKKYHGENNNSGRHCRGKWNKTNENKDYSVEIMNDEVTLMDKAYVLQGQTIIKTWHIKNNGNKDWPQDIKLKYCGKPFNPIINGVEFNVPNLKINEEGDISVIIETPKDFIGKQKANFRLFLNNNETFGRLFRVRVIVVNNYENESLPQQQEQEEKKDNNNNNEVSDVIEKLKELNEVQSVSNPSLIKKEKEDSKPNKIESSPSSFADVHVPKIEDINFDQEEEEEDDAMIIEEPEPEPEQQPIMESNINNNNNINVEEYDFDYVYQDQLNTILGMGFNDVDKIRNLLNANKGDVNVVINQLFQ